MKKYILCDVSCILILLAVTLVGGYFYVKAENSVHQVPMQPSKLHVQYPRNSDPTIFESSVKETK